MYCRRDVTNERVEEALKNHRGNLNEVARELGCSWITIRRRVEADEELARIESEQKRLHGTRRGVAARRDTEGGKPKVKAPVEIQEIIDEFWYATKVVQGLWALLEICQTRCSNAVNMRNSGHCEPPGSDDACFGARLHAADARVLAKRLLDWLEVVWDRIEDEGIAEIPKDKKGE